MTTEGTDLCSNQGDDRIHLQVWLREDTSTLVCTDDHEQLELSLDDEISLIGLSLG